MTALIRYLVGSCLHAQRWAPPGVLFLLGVAVTYVSGGSAPTTLSEGTVLLLPVTAWLTVATVNDQDPSEAAVTAAAAGSPGRAWAGKLVVAGGAALICGAISLLAAYLSSISTFTLGDLGAGLVAHLLAVTTGVALGALCARPLVTRSGPAVIGILAITVIDLIVPGAPPLRSTLTALNAAASSRLWALLALAAAETAILVAILITVAHRLNRAHP